MPTRHKLSSRQLKTLPMRLGFDRQVRSQPRAPRLLRIHSTGCHSSRPFGAEESGSFSHGASGSFELTLQRVCFRSIGILSSFANSGNHPGRMADGDYPTRNVQVLQHHGWSLSGVPRIRTRCPLFVKSAKA